MLNNYNKFIDNSKLIKESSYNNEFKQSRENIKNVMLKKMKPIKYTLSNSFTSDKGNKSEPLVIGDIYNTLLIFKPRSKKHINSELNNKIFLAKVKLTEKNR